MVATAAVEGAVGRQTRRFGRGITLPACAAPMANSLLRRTVLRLESQVATAADGPKPVGRNVGPAGAGMYWAGLWARPGVRGSISFSSPHRRTRWAEASRMLDPLAGRLPYSRHVTATIIQSLRKGTGKISLARGSEERVKQF